MRRLRGSLAAAALVAATACGQAEHAGMSRAASPDPPPDPHSGPDAVCAGCSAVADGQVTFAGTTMRFSLQAGTGFLAGADGTSQFQPGSGGIGAASSGTLSLVPVAGGDGISGVVDTAVSCGRTGGVLGGTFSGLIAGQRFTVEVTDGSASGLGDQTAVTFTAPAAMGPALVESGFLHVTDLFACHASCAGDGLCWCLVGIQCESCDQANHGQPIPACLDGTCWSPAAAACEPCLSQALP